MKIRFDGAARMVTGSCFHLTLNSRQFLDDCGMRQGKNGRELNPDSLFRPIRLPTVPDKPIFGYII